MYATLGCQDDPGSPLLVVLQDHRRIGRDRQKELRLCHGPVQEAQERRDQLVDLHPGIHQGERRTEQMYLLRFPGKADLRTHPPPLQTGPRRPEKRCPHLQELQFQQGRQTALRMVRARKPKPHAPDRRRKVPQTPPRPPRRDGHTLRHHPRPLPKM